MSILQSNMEDRTGMKSNHVKKETKRIAKLSNEDLLIETIELSAGDDYDGCFTPDGDASLEILKAELKRRLIAVGFATEKLWEKCQCCGRF
jgi:hypothetical protein